MAKHGIVIATHNIAKGGEMATIMSRLCPNVNFLTFADFPGAPEPEETGHTYIENAMIKAVSAARYTGLRSISDDAGLEVDALDGAPGVKSKRFAGESTHFDHKIAKLLEMLCGVEGPHRSARFRCAVAIANSIGNVECTFESVCEGEIALSRSGAGGFGYDSIFYLPALSCTMAELTADQKHAISHRGKVLAKVAEYLAS